MKLTEEQKRAFRIAGILLGIFSLVFIVSSGLVYFLIIKDNVPEPDSLARKYSRKLTNTTFFSRDIVRFPSSANVTPANRSDKVLKVGVDPSTGSLNFGRMYVDMPIRKFIDVGNHEDIDVKICVMKYGQIAKYINASRDSFVIKPGEQRKIQISFVSDEIGYFEGEVDIVIKKPRYKELIPLLYWVEC